MTRQGAGEVRSFEPADRRTAIATVARAFSIDPMFDHFTRDLLRAHQALPGFFGPTVVDTTTYGHAWVAEVDGTARGFAGWLGPEGFPRGVRREARLAVLSSLAFARTRDRIGGLRLLAALERAHPHEPGWYLALLAVDPSLQGTGLGSALIAPGITAADEEGLPCYLETQKEANVGWYHRFGFELVNTVQVGKVPPVWCMRRPAG